MLLKLRGSKKKNDELEIDLLSVSHFINPFEPTIVSDNSTEQVTSVEHPPETKDQSNQVTRLENRNEQPLPTPSEKQINDHSLNAPKAPQIVGVKAVNRPFKSGLSITSMLKDVSQSNAEDDPDNLENKPVDPFSTEDLLSKWNVHCHRVKLAGKQSLYATLTKDNPVLNKEDWTVSIEIDNAIQEQDLIKERINLLEFLRRELNNYAIQLNWTIVQNKEQAHLYTDKDKFLKLCEQNPSLLTLKQRLKLDID